MVLLDELVEMQQGIEQHLANIRQFLQMGRVKYQRSRDGLNVNNELARKMLNKDMKIPEPQRVANSFRKVNNGALRLGAFKHSSHFQIDFFQIQIDIQNYAQPLKPLLPRLASPSHPLSPVHIPLSLRLEDQKRKVISESGQLLFLNYSANIFVIEMDVQESASLLQQMEPISVKGELYKKRIAHADDDLRIYQTIRKKIHTDEDSISATPLRVKYSQLIPEFQSAEYTLDQKVLLRIQGRLDEHLLYLKTHRGKKKGEFFKALRKILIQGSQIIMQFHQFKQIMFIDPKLYICTRDKDKDNNYDILIDLPPSDPTTRRSDFKQKMYKYLLSQNAFQGKKKFISIPLYKFPFQEEIESNNLALLQKREEDLAETQQEEAKQENESLTKAKNVFNKSFDFKSKLEKRILQKENLSKQKACSGIGEKKYGREQVLRVADEIYLVYTSKGINNMFRVTLCEILSKKLLILDQIIGEILEWILVHSSGYLRKMAHPKGAILQLDTRNYRLFRERVRDEQL